MSTVAAGPNRSTKRFARGVAFHAIGTGRAFHVAGTAGAFASIGMILNALLTILLVPRALAVVRP